MKSCVKINEHTAWYMVGNHESHVPSPEAWLAGWPVTFQFLLFPDAQPLENPSLTP